MATLLLEELVASEQKKKHTFTKLGVDTGIAEVSDWKFCEKYRADWDFETTVNFLLQFLSYSRFVERCNPSASSIM